MPVYHSADQLYTSIKTLFGSIQDDPDVVRSVAKSRLVIRFRLTTPSAEFVVNGRQSPPQVIYGPTKLRPDLDVNITADALHYILLAELPLRKALGSGQMKVRGPVWKSFVLEDIFHRGQALYPQLVREMGIDGSDGAKQSAG